MLLLDNPVHVVGEKTLRYETKSVDSGLGNVIGSIHSRLRSVFITPQHKKKMRRRNRLRKLKTQPEENDYLSEGKGKLPKIYITKLPVDKARKEPEIFFTKVLKANMSSSVKAAQNLGDKSKSILATTDVTYNSVDEPVIKSDMLYQDGMENVNDRIHNPQQVNQPKTNVKSFNTGKKTMDYNSTVFPILSHVSSTAMIIGYPKYGLEDIEDANDNSEITEESDELDIHFGGADNVVPSNPTNDGSLSFIKDEEWVLPMIVMASVTIAGLLLFEVFVYVESRGNTLSHRHLLLGQLLMLGLLFCAVLALLHTVKPTQALCIILKFGPGLAFTLIYSTLLVKIVFLISLNSDIYLPATYQILLLFFAVLIQLVIGTHQLLASQPCSPSFHQQVQGNIYNIILMALVTILSIKFRNIKPAYREALYISLTMGLHIIIWIAWLISGHIVPAGNMTLYTSSALLATTVTTFVLMFLPKGRQLSAVGKEGVYSKDRPEIYDRKMAQNKRSSQNISLFSLNSGIVGQVLSIREYFVLP